MFLTQPPSSPKKTHQLAVGCLWATFPSSSPEPCMTSAVRPENQTPHRGAHSPSRMEANSPSGH